jgi:hypothetical protein
MNFFLLFGGEWRLNGGAIPRRWTGSSFSELPSENAAMAVCQLPVGRHQVSNESLILAQNQRWRRA